MRLFLAVVEEGSIHAGARRLMLTQPAVSQALGKLERDVGEALVIRSGRGIELTRAGSALLEGARDLLARADAVAETVRGVKASGSVLRVGLMSGLASAGDLTAPIINGFKESYPHVTLRVTNLSFANQFSAVLTREVDVAIVRPPTDDERVELVPLFTEPTVVCFSKGHRLAEAQSVRLDDVLDEPMIELVRAPRRWRDYWELNEMRGGPPRRVQCEQAVTLLELQSALVTRSVVVAAALSGWRHGLASARLRAARIVDAPHTPVAVGYPRVEPHAYAPEFALCARSVTESLTDLVPGSRLIAE